jgi:hypothetical protein
MRNKQVSYYPIAASAVETEFLIICDAPSVEKLEAFIESFNLDDLVRLYYSLYYSLPNIELILFPIRLI